VRLLFLHEGSQQRANTIVLRGLEDSDSDVLVDPYRVKAMVEIAVRPAAEGKSMVYEVEVREGKSRSRHRVTLKPADLERWGQGLGASDLVRRSFEFLLQRESKESILPEFELSVIQSYFPEYDRVMRS
jgi:hypothetical protein